MKFAAVATIALSTVVAFGTPAIATSPIKLVELNCEVSSEDGKLLSNSVILACSYIDVGGDNAGSYAGTIERAGLDIGTIKSEQFTWIISTMGDLGDAKIAGTYFGATAGASAGAGAAGNYLTGGFEGKISLQPLSAESKSGIGISLAGQMLVLEEIDS